MSIDFEREGLLDDCSGEEARLARAKLLERLSDDGVPLEDLRRAVEESRLALIPAERALTGDAAFTVSEVAERAGVEAELLLAEQQALGMPRPGPDDRVLTEDDLTAARVLRKLLDAGLPGDGILDVARVVGQAMENVAAASRQLVGEALLQPGDSELEVALRYADATTELTPLMASLLDYQYRLRLRRGPAPGDDRPAGARVRRAHGRGRGQRRLRGPRGLHAPRRATARPGPRPAGRTAGDDGG